MDNEIKNLLKASMKIISSAGDGRNLIQQAIAASSLGNENESQEYLRQANEEIKSAHIEQTKILQTKMSLENEESAKTLFTHAQDTLMTINSEYYLAVNLIQMEVRLSNRIKKIEEELHERDI